MRVCLDICIVRVVAVRLLCGSRWQIESDVLDVHWRRHCEARPELQDGLADIIKPVRLSWRRFHAQYERNTTPAHDIVSPAFDSRLIVLLMIEEGRVGHTSLPASHARPHCTTPAGRLQDEAHQRSLQAQETLRTKRKAEEEARTQHNSVSFGSKTPTVASGALATSSMRSLGGSVAGAGAGGINVTAAPAARSAIMTELIKANAKRPKTATAANGTKPLGLNLPKAR